MLARHLCLHEAPFFPHKSGKSPLSQRFPKAPSSSMIYIYIHIYVCVDTSFQNYCISSLSCKLNLCKLTVCLVWLCRSNSDGRAVKYKQERKRQRERHRVWERQREGRHVASQEPQQGLIEEYTLNHITDPSII